MSKPPIRVGDIFQIPLGNGKVAFGQYIFFDKNKGGLIKIYAKFLNDNKTIDLEDIINSDILFPPVFAGIYTAIRSGKWKIVGNMTVEKFTYPKFVSTLRNPDTGEATMWFLWDGEKYTNLGKNLTQNYKNLEFLAVYSSESIEDRIKTGKKPYEELIMKNKLSNPPQAF